MKRVLIYLLVAFLPASISAEDLQFITTLSSPLGTFSQLETADPKTAVVSPVVNFCNTRASAGRISLNGSNAYLQTLTLKTNASLGGNVQEYRLSNSLTVNSIGTLRAKRLMANNVSLSGASSINSQVNSTLYISSMNVKGAKASSLTIPSKVQTSNTGSNNDMEWSNIYSRDYTSSGSATGSSYTSYLLKSKQCNPPAGEPTTQSCPSGYTGTQTRTWNYSTCSWNAWQGTCKGDCSNYSYKSTHKSECCPGTSESDTTCWSCTTNATWTYNNYNIVANQQKCNAFLNCPGTPQNHECNNRSGPCYPVGASCQVQQLFCGYRDPRNGQTTCLLAQDVKKVCTGTTSCVRNGW